MINFDKKNLQQVEYLIFYTKLVFRWKNWNSCWVNERSWLKIVSKLVSLKHWLLWALFLNMYLLLL